MKRIQGPWATLVAGAGLVLATTLGAGCVPELGAGFVEAGDLCPPAVVEWGCLSGTELELVFSESAVAKTGDFSAGADAVITAVGMDDRRVSVSLDRAPPPGARFSLSGRVCDVAGNVTGFVLPFWGHNPNPATLVVNELVTQGSSTHPDAVEFRVVAGGDPAGLCFCVGTRADWDLRYVFPSLELAAGDYVVLHLRPQGLAEEVDELADRTASGGLDSSDSGWDLWYREGGGGLPGANGALCLYGSPIGGLMDCVLYSERSSDSDTAYDGFGTAALRDRVAAAVADGGWDIAGDRPRPEDCARSEGTTATRTICRWPSGLDEDCAEDWHIVPTSGISLGRENSPDSYVPISSP
ncbi:MAG TPA: hypothetical protein PK625_08570 [Spirochaetales bacterium]|nr:hypothetical protein [Spirochaetales bacterium]